MPDLHAAWLGALLDGEIPTETVATCDRCVMATTESSAAFRPDTKCCTFVPELHNFQVGAILADPSADQTGLRARLARKTAITPLGVGRPRSYLLVYDDGGSSLFGRSREMRCPHYLDEGGGRCGIWRHRESTCATFFCKFNRARTGATFWRSAQRVLAMIERELAWRCVAELGLDIGALEALLVDREIASRDRAVEASDLDGGESPRHRALWGEWYGREVELYRACAAHASRVSPAEAISLTGPRGRAAVAVARVHHAALLSGALPERLVVGSFRILSLGPERCTLSAHSERDPLEVPTMMLDVLWSFDGRPTDTVIAELATRDLEVEPALIGRLVDFGVLIEPIDPP